jgi:hypothetical protein
MSTLTPEQRSLRARVGAYALHAQGGTSTRAGTAAFLSRFEREVRDAAALRGEELPPDELARRARSARKAYFARLALASSRARSHRKADAVGQKPASAEEASRASGRPQSAA